jgi:hypothetical protein
MAAVRLPNVAETLSAAVVCCAVAACSVWSGAEASRPLSAADLNARASTEEADAAGAASGEAAGLRHTAEEHRAGARAIEQRETAACMGIPREERERPVFLQGAALEGVRPVTGERRFIKTTVQELRGADIIVQAQLGMTKQWLARIVRCHLARHDVLGSGLRESFEDPLLAGVPEVSFDETETGFVVRIRGHDKVEGEEILRRAMRIAERR